MEYLLESKIRPKIQKMNFKNYTEVSQKGVGALLSL